MKATCVYTLRFFLYFITQHWNRVTCSFSAVGKPTNIGYEFFTIQRVYCSHLTFHLAEGENLKLEGRLCVTPSHHPPLKKLAKI